ncbi:MAG: hypothetical protein HQM00_11610 [Magnetococcales bacterium]|nr:hypothetical protein [Magnetococcales bacterium]
MMRKGWSVALVAGALLVSGMMAGTASATEADDKAWVLQCIKDNAGEGQTPKVVESYCTCMVDLMPESTNQSVTQWEKTHKKEDEKCSAQAGWKGR